MVNGKTAIAWDVDDTLIIPAVANVNGYTDCPNYEIIELYRFFEAQGHYMIIWSGSGMDWAETWANKLGLRFDEVRPKEKCDDIDIAFDDCVVDLAKVNIRVKRIKNGISRAEWNKTKRL